MTELSSLAKDHGLENDLFYWSGVENASTIMGKDRKGKFVLKRDVRLGSPQTWVKIREIFEKGLSECEKLALFAIKIPKKAPPAKIPQDKTRMVLILILGIVLMVEYIQRFLQRNAISVERCQTM